GEPQSRPPNQTVERTSNRWNRRGPPEPRSGSPRSGHSLQCEKAWIDVAPAFESFVGGLCPGNVEGVFWQDSCRPSSAFPCPVFWAKEATRRIGYHEPAKCPCSSCGTCDTMGLSCP